jgi:hypothetical protein
MSMAEKPLFIAENKQALAPNLTHIVSVSSRQGRGCIDSYGSSLVLCPAYYSKQEFYLKQWLSLLCFTASQNASKLRVLLHFK